jgi:16S rRNA (cytidine1402-2'-O)-methyltransferase
LRDITLRALDVLSAADMILAEDTRQTRKLLEAYDINTPLTAYHDHNAAKRLPSLLEKLAGGAALALVSDAGTPLVFRLARAASEAGHDVVPLPGASALLAALVTAGLPSDVFTFAGFLPAKSGARKAALTRFSQMSGTLIFFESPVRLAASLDDMLGVFGERPAAIARELTKRYEETRRGTLSELLAGVKSDPPRGEIVVLVGGQDEAAVWSEAEVDKALAARVPKAGVKSASAEIAALASWKKRDVYQRALKLPDPKD